MMGEVEEAVEQDQRKLLMGRMTLDPIDRTVLLEELLEDRCRSDYSRSHR